jgi:hypothetical protein
MCKYKARRTDVCPGEIRTGALRGALRRVRDEASAADLLFLEAWEIMPSSSIAAMLRVAQIRRANPELAVQIRDEVHKSRSR